jgi:hypothetical protein
MYCNQKLSKKEPNFFWMNSNIQKLIINRKRQIELFNIIFYNLRDKIKL